ncbi:MAG: hypothetical protein R2867_16190 [Caldilineaceae bacterium]
MHLTCPAGQVTNDRTKSGSADGWNFRFTAAQCAGCPLFAQCRGPEGKPDTAPEPALSLSKGLYQRTSLLPTGGPRLCKPPHLRLI